MKKFLLSMLGSSALAALMLYGLLSVAPVVRASVACSVPFIFTNGQTADATQVNANFNSLVNCFASAAASGVNNDITALNALSTPISPSQGGTQSYWGGTATGTNTIAVTTVTPTAYTLAPNNQICFIAGGSNAPGAVTLNVNGTGAKPLVRYVVNIGGLGGGTLVGGEIVNSGLVCVVYTGGSYVLHDRLDYIGEIKDFGYAGCPPGWAEANGTNNTFSTSVYFDIAAAFGTTWGTNAGFTVMPDLRGTAVFGRDSGGSARITAAGGNFDGTIVGNVQYRQNWTLTAAQVPIITPTTASASFAATNSASYTPTGANGAPGFSGTTVTNFSLNQAGIIQITGGTFIGGNSYTPQSSAFITPTAQNPGGQFSSITPNFTYTPAGSVSAPSWSATNSLSYTPTGSVSVTMNSFGSGASHPIIPNAGIVTKCVKL